MAKIECPGSFQLPANRVGSKLLHFCPSCDARFIKKSLVDSKLIPSHNEIRRR